MKLSTRARYGLRAMLVLAQSGGQEPVMSKEIADKQNLPVTYLEQLMLTLRKTGLVVAIRGAKGGYTLAKDPAEITLADIVQALEGPLDIAECEDVPSCCLAPDACALQTVFQEANQALRDVFSRRSLAQLAEEQRAKDAASSGMYYI